MGTRYAIMLRSCSSQRNLSWVIKVVMYIEGCTEAVKSMTWNTGWWSKYPHTFLKLCFGVFGSNLEQSSSIWLTLHLTFHQKLRIKMKLLLEDYTNVQTWRKMSMGTQQT